MAMFWSLNSWRLCPVFHIVSGQTPLNSLDPVTPFLSQHPPPTGQCGQCGGGLLGFPSLRQSLHSCRMLETESHYLLALCIPSRIPKLMHTALIQNQLDNFWMPLQEDWYTCGCSENQVSPRVGSADQCNTCCHASPHPTWSITHLPQKPAIL